MGIHKEFCKKLWDLKEAPVHRILGGDGIGLFINEVSSKGNNIALLDEITNILNTIDDLQENGYITYLQNDGREAPSLSHGFQPRNLSDNDYLRYTQFEFEIYYGKVFRVRRSLRGFIKDKFKTDKQRKERRNYKLNYISVFAAVFSAIAAFASVYAALTTNNISRESNRISSLSNQAIVSVRDFQLGHIEEDSRNNIRIPYQYSIGNSGRVPAEMIHLDTYIVPLNSTLKFPDGKCGSRPWNDDIKERLQPNVFLPFGSEWIVLPAGNQETAFAFVAIITYKDLNGMTNTEIWRKFQPKSGVVSYLLESEAKQIDGCLQSLKI